ncbi:MAG: hypothetical protein LJE69_02645 [Thiohalocapsa sp.]|uniref:hypothetical protein n=1 Tax=Thiohalocapsa sp. TaxID=2497641 RepID=UPI0025F1A825|nr:hypothetical protein [Thiohalocapsa sp.]MCG6940132.1 hypothetical protein [Thiohalocapsa sp.]
MTALLAAACDAVADNWRGELESGGTIVVDPGTHRALRQDGGTTRQLWDGVHRLEDGSTVIVRDGVAVPTEEMYRAWAGGPTASPIYADRWCMQLVRKTCGFDDACDTVAPCLQARTLLAEAERERRDLAITRGPAADTVRSATEPRCRQALADPAFPACASLTSGGDSRCRELVLKVCGAKDACADSPACDAARQLQSLETDERLTVADPAALTGTGQQCLEALHNDFFVACDTP